LYLAFEKLTNSLPVNRFRKTQNTSRDHLSPGIGPVTEFTKERLHKTDKVIFFYRKTWNLILSNFMVFFTGLKFSGGASGWIL
jgi:hypothetical protein